MNHFIKSVHSLAWPGLGLGLGPWPAASGQWSDACVGPIEPHRPASVRCARGLCSILHVERLAARGLSASRCKNRRRARWKTAQRASPLRLPSIYPPRSVLAAKHVQPRARSKTLMIFSLAASWFFPLAAEHACTHCPRGPPGRPARTRCRHVRRRARWPAQQQSSPCQIEHGSWVFPSAPLPGFFPGCWTCSRALRVWSAQPAHASCHHVRRHTGWPAQRQWAPFILDVGWPHAGGAGEGVGSPCYAKIRKGRRDDGRFGSVHSSSGVQNQSLVHRVFF